MELPTHHFAELFDQLGLPSDTPSIKAFIASHAPLADTVRLEEAGFWTPAQAQLLAQERGGDADWAILVDRLDLALRGRG
jgi:hypothetical protein